MLFELLMGLKQKFYVQKLKRKPEPNMLMLNVEEDIEYSRAAKKSSLNVAYDLVTNTLLKIAPKGGNALDLACGSGELLFRFSNEFSQMNFIGVDLSKTMLDIANEKKNKLGINNVNFKKLNIFDIDKKFEEKSFDLITWNFAMHHCETKSDVVLILNKLDKLLKPDGTLFIIDLIRLKTEKMSKDYVNYTSSGLGKYFYEDSFNSYLAAFSYNEVREILNKSKLKSYNHIKPFLFEVVQIIYKSKISNNNLVEVSNLISKKQKLDYKLLKFGFMGKL
ncbi:MAG: class I SAM-dependent methyltransferase [Nanoarchaeota archaeon]|nr:class I SAM-dependent methyltransferase [Nanoarchaeota archaeon]